MTVDFLIDWFSTIGNFPILAFILAVVISGFPLIFTYGTECYGCCVC
ncbi:MAG: hypothetical protein Ct9H300mP18_06180 [Candidatus Neomarinimicrobiota bacterium]|nr:MAG: hypothetical protein Ct9H300mP18_06180 [Candidatus Neomarinimicrobiota bacterium]